MISPEIPFQPRNFSGIPFQPRNFSDIPFQPRNVLGSPRNFSVFKVFNPNSKKFLGIQSQVQEISRVLNPNSKEISRVFNPNSKKFLGIFNIPLIPTPRNFPGIRLIPSKFPWVMFIQNSTIRNLHGYIIPNP